MKTVYILYASTSGHTEYVVETLAAALRAAASAPVVETQRVEHARPEDLLRGDVLVLASGTWNTGGVEGQLNPHFHDFLKGPAKDIDLAQKPVALIALGDDRYFYTARAGEHLRQFVQTHNGTVLGTPLAVINEPYGQEERVRRWGEKLLSLLPSRS